MPAQSIRGEGRGESPGEGSHGPEVSHALAVTDTLSRRTLAHAVDDLLSQGLYQRVYVGSYFCDRYLMSQVGAISEFLGTCRDQAIPATLVIPIIGERNLDALFPRLQLLYSDYVDVIDEVTCNDIGMLAWCGGALDVRVNAGRLLSRDLRDPRQAGFRERVWEPTLVRRSLAQAFPGCRVDGLEFDPFHQVLDLSRSRAGEGVGYALHADWCYATTGKVCEIAAVGQPLRRKFRASAPCTQPCLSFTLEHLPSGPGLPSYVKHGRTTYYPEPGARIVGVEGYRLVHHVLLEELCERERP